MFQIGDDLFITINTYGACKDGTAHSQARTGGVPDTTPDTRLC